MTPSVSPLTIHVRKIIDAAAAWRQARITAIREHEARGARIIDGGATSPTTWHLTDWRTGETLADHTTHPGYTAAVHALAGDTPWIQFDELSDAGLDDPPPTPGVSPQLADALYDWVHDVDTPDEAVAAAAGWALEATRTARSEITAADIDDLR
ncbi:hypothetical protein ACQEU3_40060 [Spirillospora sp. CA-253888]